MCWWSFLLTQHPCVQFNTLTGCSCLLIFSALRNRQYTRMYACAVHPVYTYVNTCSLACVCMRARIWTRRSSVPGSTVSSKSWRNSLIADARGISSDMCVIVSCFMHIIRAYRGTKYVCKVSLEKKERAKVRGIINDKRAYNTRYTFVGRFHFIIFAAAFLSRFQLSQRIYATIFYHAWTSCTVINYKSMRHRTKQREIARNLRSEFQENTQRILV